MLPKLSNELKPENGIREIPAEIMFEKRGLDPAFGDKLAGFSVGADQMKADNINLKSKQTSDKVITISPNDGEIQDYLDLLNSFGGGTLYLLAGTFLPTKNISLYTNIRLIGAGKDTTIIDFAGAAYGVTMIGTLASNFLNNRISDLTVQNSNATAGIDIDYCKFFGIENVRVTSCDQKGVRIQRSQRFNLYSVMSDANAGSCFEIRGDSNGTTRYFSLNNCFAASTGAGNVGFLIHAGANKLFYGKFIGCTASACSGDGFDLDADSASAIVTSFVGCLGTAGGAIGFDSNANIQQAYFIGCQSILNTGEDFQISGGGCSLIGCQTDGVYNLEASCISVGNKMAVAGDPSTEMIIGTGNIQAIGNLGEGTRTRRVVLRMKNTSGGALGNGTVVILKSVATGDEITTTTSAGDNKVFGMLNEAGNNNEWRSVLVEGITGQLKVNGAVAISIGDFLSCHTSAGIAAKASAGHTVIAVALEAYSTADDEGVISALIISPRMI